MNTGRGTPAHAERYTAPNVSPRAGMPAVPLSAVAAVYVAIKEDLLVGEYALGVRLAEERLARNVGVSRTPVREALLRLHAEGLVCRHPGGGYSPTVPNIAEVRELYEVRVALERSGILRPRTIGRPHDQVALQSLRDDWSIMAETAATPTPEFVVYDESFHVRLAEASGNREMATLLQRINERIRIVRMRDFLTMDRIAQTIDEHLGLVNLLIDGRIDAALRAYDEHVQTSLEVVEQRVAGALLQMASRR